MAAFSPKKLKLLYQASPKSSAHKRSLFPSSSPQSNDLGLMAELDSEDSEVYSPPLTSPSLSITPAKNSPNRLRKISVACNLNFNSPRRSPRNKAQTNLSMSSNKSLQKSSRKGYLENERFEDLFVTLLPGDHGKENISEGMKAKSSDDLTTPKKIMNFGNKYREVRRSPRSASKKEVVIKPSSFYGKAAPILATNQSNRIQGMKCVFRPPQQSRAKAKLNFEDKPSRKRERSKSMDVAREAKRRKPVFTGVHHAIPKPAKHSPPVERKPESIREKACKVTDLSRTPYNVKKRKSEGWEYTLRFTKPMRYEDSPNLGEKRKFFKTMVRDQITSPSIQKEEPLHFVPQKRIKLLDSQKCYLEEESPKAKINTSDIQDLIEDNEMDKLQEKPEVDDILLRLEEEEDDEEKKRETERQMLMNILENSPMKFGDIDSLSNCTASMDLNDSISNSGCSRFSLDDGKENEDTPPRFFSIFKDQSSSSSKKVLSDVTQRNVLLSSKKKWRGVGGDQLQIDAGQKRYGAQQCAECGMLYQAGEAEDEMQHSAFHANLSTLRHMGWKNENVVGCFGTDYVIVVTGEDAKSWQKKAQEVMALVDKSLGITPEPSNVMHNQKIFLYVSDKRIVGCMVASPMTRAYKMISSESDVDICSEESYGVRCGVSRMWTLFTHRRRGVASKILDTVRRNFMYGHILSREDVAFSIPTPDGKRFATKYMGTPNFFVYTGY